MCHDRLKVLEEYDREKKDKVVKVSFSCHGCSQLFFICDNHHKASLAKVYRNIKTDEIESSESNKLDTLY